MYTGIAIHTTLISINFTYLLYNIIADMFCVDTMKNLYMYNKASDLITWRWFGPDRCTHALIHVGQSSTMNNV